MWPATDRHPPHRAGSRASEASDEVGELCGCRLQGGPSDLRSIAGLHHVSQRIRKRVEEPFGWIKTIGEERKLRYIGQQRNRAWFKIEAAVYNLIRITALDAAPA